MIVVALPLALVPVVMRRRLGMSVGANIVQWALTGCVSAGLLLVTLRVVQNLLLGMSMVALNAQRAHVHVDRVVQPLDRLDVRAHRRLVGVDEGVASQPALVDVDVRKRTEGMVVFVSLGAPRSPELG